MFLTMKVNGAPAAPCDYSALIGPTWQKGLQNMDSDATADTTNTATCRD
jgi:hypothetical protein